MQIDLQKWKIKYTIYIILYIILYKMQIIEVPLYNSLKNSFSQKIVRWLTEVG